MNPEAPGATGPQAELASSRRWLIITATTVADVPPLPGMRRGVERLRSALQRVGEEQVEVLHNPSAAEAMRAIRLAVTDEGRASDDRTAVIYIGGHGRAEELRGDSILLAGDAGRRSGSLSIRELHAAFQGPGQRILLLDTMSIRNVGTRYPWAPGTAILYAGERSGPDEVFVDSLIQGIEKGEADVDGDGRIDIGELYRYVGGRLAPTVGGPRPELVVMGNPADFVVARAPGPRQRRNREPMAERLPPLLEPFVDRESEMEALRSLLEERPSGNRTAPFIVQLVGEPGIGKTQIVLRAIRLLRRRYPHGVLYTSAQAPDAAVAEFASALGYRGQQSTANHVSFLSEATANLAILFVLDDIGQQYGDFVTLLPVGPACSVLIVARTTEPSALPPAAERLSLGPLGIEASQALLAEYARLNGIEFTSEAAALAEDRGNPFYIRLLGMLDPHEGHGQLRLASLEDFLTAWYVRLPTSVAALFRRASLADAEGLDREFAKILLDGTEDQAAFDALVRSGMVIEMPDGRVDFAHRSIRDFAAQRLTSDDDLAETEALREKVRRWILVNRHFQPEPRIARDFWTTSAVMGNLSYSAASSRVRAT